jgi:hypothetical protein
MVDNSATSKSRTRSDLVEDISSAMDSTHRKAHKKRLVEPASLALVEPANLAAEKLCKIATVLLLVVISTITSHPKHRSLILGLQAHQPCHHRGILQGLSTAADKVTSPQGTSTPQGTGAVLEDRLLAFITAV